MCKINNEPYTKSNRNSNAIAKQRAAVSIKLKLVYKTTVFRLVNAHHCKKILVDIWNGSKVTSM